MADFYDIKNPQTLIAIMNSPLRPKLKIQLMDYLENVTGEITQDISRDNSGNIEINYQQGVRRSCSITLINIGNLYNPSFNKGLWFHTKFKVYIGFETNSDTYWFSQGIYILTNPNISDENSNQTITLNGVDKFGVLGAETSFHELEGIYKIPAGTRIRKALQSILSLPIGNQAGQLLTCTITGAEYWAGANSSTTGGYFLTQQFNLIPSAIKQITITRGTTQFQNNSYAYNTGTSSLWFSAKSGTQDYILSSDSITIVAYEGYPLDPKPPIIDNRTITYSDAIEFFGSEKKDTSMGNRYILTDMHGDLYSIKSIAHVYVDREEIPLLSSTSTGLAYTFNPNDNGLWFNGNIGDSQLISVIATINGTIGDIELPYDVEKSPNEFFADILIELATIVACDVYYDEFGYLNFVKGNEKPEMDNLPTVWEFSEDNNNYFNANLDMDFTNMFNVIKVVGTNENAKDICEYTAKNLQLNSAMCVQILGEKIKYVESSFCYNQPRTVDFANYLLYKYSRVQATLGFESSIIPFLDVNTVISITDTNLQYERARFIIQSLSIPLTTSAAMSIDCSDTANIPYFADQGG